MTKDKYDPKICKPLFGAVIGDTKPIYELKHASINCIGCKNYVMFGGGEFCAKASELENIVKK